MKHEIKRSKLKLAKHSQTEPISSTSRLSVVCLWLLIGICAGFASAVLWGSGLKPDYPTEVGGKFEKIGLIEVVRLPVGARNLEGVSTFNIEGGGADDYGRIFVNNYLVGNNENPAEIFYTTKNSGQLSRERVTALAADRAVNMVGKRDVKVFLRKGWNYVVVENENSILGTCVMGFNFLVNGTNLESFPRTVPNRFEVEDSISNVQLRTALDRNGRDDLIPELSFSATDDALCARRVFAFNLN